MSHDKQFTLFTHGGGGPNGWKVMMVLEELGLTYEPIYMTFDEMKKPKFTKYNPNGRIPAIIDHKNGDFVLWESNAILQYLVDKYDPTHKISVAEGDEKHVQNQWLYFQASGQGPYYGQGFFFALLHPEKLPSAIERYRNEARRILGVLESVLSKQEWLVGNKPTIADISFIPWNGMLNSSAMFGPDFDFAEEFPATAAWDKKVRERPAIQKVYEIRQPIVNPPKK